MTGGVERAQRAVEAHPRVLPAADGGLERVVRLVDHDRALVDREGDRAVAGVARHVEITALARLGPHTTTPSSALASAEAATVTASATRGSASGASAAEEQAGSASAISARASEQRRVRGIAAGLCNGWSTAPTPRFADQRERALAARGTRGSGGNPSFRRAQPPTRPTRPGSRGTRRGER